MADGKKTIGQLVGELTELAPGDFFVIQDVSDDQTKKIRKDNAAASIVAGLGLTKTYQNGSTITVDAAHGPVKITGSDPAVDRLIVERTDKTVNGELATFTGAGVGQRLRVVTPDGVLDLLGNRIAAGQGITIQPFAGQRHTIVEGGNGAGVGGAAGDGRFAGGDGAAGDGTTPGGAGGAVEIAAGLGGADGGAGAGADGAVVIYAGQASAPMADAGSVHIRSATGPIVLDADAEGTNIRVNGAGKLSVWDSRVVLGTNFEPDADDTRDIGADGKSIRDGYIGRILAAFGSIAEPSYSFRAAPGTGISFDATQGLQIVYGSAEHIRVRAGQTIMESQLVAQAGSEASPGIVAEGFPGTGFRWVTNNVRVVTGGADRVQFTSTVVAPAFDKGIDLGNVTVGWGDGHIDRLFSSSASVGGTTIDAIGVRPSADLGRPCGTSANRWSEVWQGKSAIASGSGINPSFAETFAAITTDPTPLDVWTGAWERDHHGWVRAEITARDITTEEVALYILRARWQVDASGTLTVLSATTVEHEEEPGGGWDPAAVIKSDGFSGIIVELSGDTGRELHWSGTVRWQACPPL